MAPFLNAAASIAMAQSRLTTDNLKSSSVEASDGKLKSSSAEAASENSPRFTKSSEDRNGMLRVTNGQIFIGKRRRLLLVGSGIRKGQEGTKEQAVYAVHATDEDGLKRCQYYWGPAGQETKARYKDVRRWMPGFWKDQITNSLLTDEESRMGRIWNIFHGEKLDQAMATCFDPATLVGHRQASTEARSDRKRKDIDNSDGENENDEVKRVKQSSSTPAPTAAMSTSCQTQWPNFRMAEAATPAPDVNSAKKQSDSSLPNSLVFNKTDEDLDVDLDLVFGKAYGSAERVGLLHVGMGVKERQTTATPQAVFARMLSGTNSYGLVNYYWGPAGSETRAEYGDVDYWFRGLWKQQISGHGITDEAARALRVRAIYKNTETIQEAMLTRLDASTVKLMQNLQRPVPKRNSLATTAIHHVSVSNGSVHHSDEPRTSRVAKSAEDNDGELAWAKGRPILPEHERVNILQIGLGMREGHEDKNGEPQIIYARIKGPRGSESTSYYWGPPGREAKAQYDDVQSWFRGFWKNQVSGLGVSDEVARAIRLRNICHGVESIEHAMDNVMDTQVVKLNQDSQTSQLKPPVQHRSSRGRFGTKGIAGSSTPAKADNKLEEVDSKLDDEDDDDYPPLPDHLPMHSAKSTFASTLPSGSRATDHTGAEFSFKKTLSDVDRQPWKETSETFNGFTKTMLAAGTTLDGEIMFVGLESASIMESGTTRQRTSYHLGLNGPRASYNDVAYWFRGFWTNQCAPNSTIRVYAYRKCARSARVTRIIKGLETIEQAMRSTVVGAYARGQVGAESEALAEHSGTDTEDEDERLTQVTKKQMKRSSMDVSSTRNDTQDSALTARRAENIDKIPDITCGRIKRDGQLRTMIAVGETEDIKTPSTLPSGKPKGPTNPSKMVSSPFVAPQAAMKPISTHTPASSALADIAPIEPIFTPSTLTSATTIVSTSTASNADPTTTTMTFDEAYAIFSDEQNVKRNPQGIQTAMSVLAGSTPPLRLIQQACFACRMGKIQSIYDFEGLRKWMQESDMMS